MARVFIGLGSNVGDRTAYLLSAAGMIRALPGTELVAESSIIETRAVDFLEQPDFMNQVLLVETELLPHVLLESLQGIENLLGRIRRFPKGPREIDIDILLYDDLVLNDESLVIPHPEITRREFVIKHLLELDPGLSDPVTGIKYKSFSLKFVMA